MNDIRLSIILPKLRGGGIEKSFLYLCRAFQERGINVDLVLGQLEGELVEDVPANTLVYVIAKRNRLLFFPGLFRYLKKHRPTHVISGFDDVNYMVIACNYLLGSNAKVLVSNHNNLSEVFKNAEGLESLKYRFLSLILGRAYKKAFAVTAVSKGVADDLSRVLRIPRSIIEVIYNPVISPDFSQRVHDGYAEKFFEIYLNDRLPTVTFVGRLCDQKKVDILIRAFAVVRNKKEARLVIVGSGPNRGELEELASSLGIGDFITFAGFQVNPIPAISKSSLLVLCSAYEGLGNVLIEAMACGTQVVSTDCPYGPAEILENGRLGQLVPVGSEMELAEAILRTLNREFWVAPEELILKAGEFQVDGIADQYLAVLGLMDVGG